MNSLYLYADKNLRFREFKKERKCPFEHQVFQFYHSEETVFPIFEKHLSHCQVCHQKLVAYAKREQAFEVQVKSLVLFRSYSTLQCQQKLNEALKQNKIRRTRFQELIKDGILLKDLRQLNRDKSLLIVFTLSSVIFISLWISSLMD